MVAPILALHGLLIAGAIVVKTANNVIESFSHQDATQAMEEALSLDIKAPMDIVSYFITSYDHLHHDDWHGLKSWLSSYNPPKKIYGNAHALRQSEDANTPQQYSYCVVAETILMTSVDSIMDSIVPKKHKEIGSSSTSMARRKRAELEHRTTVPFNVCMEWTLQGHADKPNDWTHVALAITASRIRTIDSTAVRLAILQSEVQPDEIPLLILDLVLQQRVDTLTAMTATIMRWIQKQSEDMVREDSEARSLTAAVKRLIKHVGSVDKVLSEEAKEAIRSNYAQEILDKIDDLLSAENYTKGWNGRGGESRHEKDETSRPIDKNGDRVTSPEPENSIEDMGEAGRAETVAVWGQSYSQDEDPSASASHTLDPTNEDRVGANVGDQVDSQPEKDPNSGTGETLLTEEISDVEDRQVELRPDAHASAIQSKENQKEEMLQVSTDQGGAGDEGGRDSDRSDEAKASPVVVEMIQKSHITNQAVAFDDVKNGQVAGKASNSKFPIETKNSPTESNNRGRGEARQEGMIRYEVENNEESRKTTIDSSQNKVNFIEGSYPDQKRYLLIAIAAALFFFNFYLCVTR